MEEYILIIIDKKDIIDYNEDPKWSEWKKINNTNGEYTFFKIRKDKLSIQENIVGIYGIEHCENSLMNWILDVATKKIKTEFINFLPEEISKEKHKIIIAGHWGDKKILKDYETMIKEYNDENNGHYFISYYGGCLGSTFQNLETTIIQQIIELSGLSTKRQIQTIFNYYHLQMQALKEYINYDEIENKTDKETNEKLKEDNDTNIKFEELTKQFIKEIETLEVTYKKIINELKN